MPCLLATNSNPGVYWNGVGNNYSHNRVSNSPHVCFLGGGNEGQPYGGDNVESGAGSQCVFDSNSLDSCVYECADCGAFYTSGGDGMAWVNRGNRLTNSNFTNIGSVGVYLLRTIYFMVYTSIPDLCSSLDTATAARDVENQAD